MGVTGLKHFETENSLTRVKDNSLILTYTTGLFHFCQFGIRKTETH